MDQPVFDWERLFDTSSFDRETLLDLTVNVIPLVILGFFFALFLVVGSWGFDGVLTTLQLAIIGHMFVGLVIVSWVSGALVSRDEAAEEEGEEREEREENGVEGEEADRAVDEDRAEDGASV